MTDGTLSQDSGSQDILYMAMELSASTWVLAFSDGGARKVRRKRIDAGDLEALEREIARAKAKFGLDASAPVVSCYEAGRDGFWIHRTLSSRNVENHVVDPASIEVNRRFRRAKSDKLDVDSLLRTLIRFQRGDRDAWRTVRVPSEADEDARRLPRERDRLKKEVTQLRNRIRGLLATQGVKVEPDRLRVFLESNPCATRHPHGATRSPRSWDRVEGLDDRPVYSHGTEFASSRSEGAGRRPTCVITGRRVSADVGLGAAT